MTTIHQVLDNDEIFSWFEELSDTDKIIKTLIRLAEKAKVSANELIDMIDAPRETIFEVCQDFKLLKATEEYDCAFQVYPTVAFKDKDRALCHPMGFYAYMCDHYELTEDQFEHSLDFYADEADGFVMAYKGSGAVWVKGDATEDDILEAIQEHPEYENFAELIEGYECVEDV